MQNLGLVLLEIGLVSVRDRCMVCTIRTIGSENCFECTGWYSRVSRLKSKLLLDRLETVLVLVQHRCTVCTKCSIASEIVLDAPDGTPR
jgi:hypothetical protein